MPLRCRKNVKALGADEKRRFVRAIKGLKARDSSLNPGSQSRYDDYVKIHRSAMDAAMGGAAGWAHRDSAFFPWHRELLYRFEEELRSIEPGVTIPYWDWTRAQANGNPGWPFTHDFIGVDGNNANQDRVEREAGAPSPYPYEFDPDTWTIVVKDSTSEPSFLTRDFGSRSDAPGLPQNDVIATGSNTTFRAAIGSSAYLTLRSRSEDLHNLVHRWVNGNMITGSSPNDPIFWMHHAAIDRMWTLWQEKNPALTPYVHVNGIPGHGLNDTLIFNFPGDPAPWSGTATPNQLIDSHAMHGTSIWYQSDLPELTLESGPSIAFGGIPQGMTQYRAAHFRIRTCRQVRFRIIGAPSGNFGLTPLGTQFIVEPDLAADAVDGYVWVQFVANGASPQFSSVTVEAYLIDEEGYYATSEGGEVSLGTFTIGLSASVVPREDNSVVLVLDRSGSMAAPAGGGSTRSELLKSAVSVFHTLLRPAEEIGIVSFDDVTDTLLPLTTQAAGLGTTLTGNGLDPRGLTGIGLGIQAGATMLAGASHTNRALLVLTDGNQNVHPYVEELPAGTITNRTYAIGFGLPGEVSDAVLNTITQNTQGDLIITGQLATQQERFLLTKYFVQILAGVTNANVVLDPLAELLLGSKHSIPFPVVDSDVSIDVILLAPLAALVDVVVKTPGGTEITPALAATEPNISFEVGAEVAFYRIDLPALPADPGGSHAGTWEIVVRIRTEGELKELLRGRELGVRGMRELAARGSLPYNCVVHARSNLDFSASAAQVSFTPGSPVALEATLREYAVPFAGSAAVWADVATPDGATARVALGTVGPGKYRGEVKADKPGVYRLRVRAEGATSSGFAFAREKTLTASAFAGATGTDPGLDRLIDELRERDEAWCQFLLCVAESGLEARGGVDPGQLRRCVERLCASLERREREPRPVSGKMEDVKADELAEVLGRAMVTGGVAALMQRREEPEIEHVDADAARAAATERNELREKMIAETDDPGLMMFPPIPDPEPEDQPEPKRKRPGTRKKRDAE
jgi:hypothetical protein